MKFRFSLYNFPEIKIEKYICFTSFLIVISLFNGFLLYFLTFRDYVLSDTLRALLIDFSLFSPVLFLPKKLAKLYISLVLSFAVISSLINVLHIILYKNFISFWAIQAIFETTNKEAGEFTEDFLSFKLLFTWFMSVLIPILVFKFAKKNFLKIAKVKLLPYFLLLFSAIILFVSVTKGVKFYNSHYMCLNIWSINKYLGEERVVVPPSEEKIKKDLGRLNIDFDKINLVVIVGEAANRNHMSSYGYPRKTTPRLNSLLGEDKNLLKFNDVISSATHTVPSLKNGLMFTQKRFSEPYVSVVDALNHCRFKTFWFSNQTAASTSGNVLEQITERATIRKYVNYADRERSSVHFDEELLPLLDIALQDTSSRKAIFLHFLGSHLTCSMRYPREWDCFTNQSLPESKKNLEPKYKKQINSYDNSLLYNDYVVCEVLKICKNAKLPTVFCYFSDHGQEVYDCRKIRGCDAGSPTKNMVEIPFFIWGSPDYVKTMGDKWAILERNLNFSYSTMSLSNDLLQLSGINSERLCEMSSLFNVEQYKQGRYIFDFSYKKVLENSNSTF